MTLANSIDTPPEANRRAQTMVAAAYKEPAALARRFRLKRFERVMAMIARICAEKGRCRIADIGGTKYYWDIVSDFVATHPVEITLINLNERVADEGKFRGLAGDATDLAGLADNSFDMAHSNSVIEHVGDWTKMCAMAETVRRLAPAYYVQCPNFWFPIEPHFRCAFIHWLPEQVRYRLVKKFAFGFAPAKQTVGAAMERVQSARLLDRGQMTALFPDGAITAERFLGLAKSWIAIRE